MKRPKWDAFISHATEDKNEVARPLFEMLRQAGLKIWFDEETIMIGSSIRKSIDEGLGKSKFGIVILSPAFFKKKWTQDELGGLFAKRSLNDGVIIPIWHGLSQKEIAEISPLLADIKALNTNSGIKEITDEIIARIKGKPPVISFEVNPNFSFGFEKATKLLSKGGEYSCIKFQCLNPNEELPVLFQELALSLELSESRPKNFISIRELDNVISILGKPIKSPSIEQRKYALELKSLNASLTKLNKALETQILALCKIAKHEGFNKNYERMTKIFLSALDNFYLAQEVIEESEALGALLGSNNYCNNNRNVHGTKIEIYPSFNQYFGPVVYLDKDDLKKMEDVLPRHGVGEVNFFEALRFSQIYDWRMSDVKNLPLYDDAISDLLNRIITDLEIDFDKVDPRYFNFSNYFIGLG